MSAAQQFGESGVTDFGLQQMLGISTSRFRYFLSMVVLAGIYFAAAKFGLSLASVHTNVSPVWPPTGIAIAAVLLLGYRAWPAILVGAFLANLLTPISMAAAGAIAIGNTLEAVVAAGALNALGFQNSFQRARDIFKFVSVALLCTMLSATLGTLSLCLSHAAPWTQFSSLWLTWWLGDLTGAVTVAPLILTWCAGAGHWLPKRRYFEATVLILLLSISAIVTFGGKAPTPVHYYPLTRLMVPFLLWAAFRLGRRGVTVAVVVISAFAIWGTWRGFGPFISGAPNDSLLLLQLFIATNAVTFLFLVSVVEERRIAEEARLRDGRRLEANLAVTRTLAESPETNAALQQILATVGETLSWEFGCVWVPAADGKVLRSVAIWQAGSNAPRFEALSRERTFELGVGLPGRVWATRAPAWIRDVAKDDNFPRARIAIQEGLHAGFAFPILFNDELLGVIEFFSFQIRQPDEALLAMFAGIGGQIGQFMERKRAEEALRQNEERLRLATTTGKVGVWDWDIVRNRISWTDSLYQIHGVTKEQFDGTVEAFSAFVHPDDRERVSAAIQRSLETDAPYQLEMRTVRPNGEVIWIYTNAAVLREGDKPVRMLGGTIDISDIKRAEIALRESEERYRSVIEALPAAVYTTDEAGRITMFNQAAVDFSGRVPEIGSDSWCVTWKLYHTDGRPMPHDECPMAMALKEGKPNRGQEAIAERPDGSRVNFIPYPTPLRDSSGKVTGAINMLIDITERKRAEMRLRDREQRLGAFFSSAALGVAVLTPEAKFVQVNDTFCRIVGYSREELTGMNCADLTHADDLAPMKDKLASLISDRISRFEIEKRYIRKDGQEIWVENSVSATRDGAGHPLNMVFICQDITDRKRTEQTMRHFAAIVESTDDAVISKDLNGIITSWNPAAERLYGYKAEEVVGKSVTILIPENRPDEEPAILRKLRKGLRIDHYETIRVAKDGRRLNVSLTVSPIHDATGKIIGASKIARDITQQKKTQDEIARLLAAERAARQEAEVASRTKDEFLAVLSHELRTPLTAMLGWLSILRGHNLDEKTTEHAIETIERNAKAQAQLIEDLVDVSRIVGGKLNLEVSPIDLLPVINAAIEVVRPAADAKEIAIDVNYDSPVGLVSGDPSRLQQIIWNLLSNAVKFTPKGGTVQVDFRRHDSYAEIVVRDNGIGIASDFLPYVFERFRQAESTATRSHRGMGLGLAIVRHLIELHGGSVWASSEGENRGSSFTVHLPLAALQRTSLSAASVAAGNGEHENVLNGLRILLVEDEPDARELIAMLLQGSGASVEAVDSAGDALTRLPLFIPDLLLSDIGLPKESGYDLIRQVRALASELNKVPAIALTAFATESDRKMSLSAGFQAHLAKPVEPALLVTTIMSLLNGTGNGNGKT